MQVSWILMLIHGIPESLLFVLGIYVISEKKLNIKIYFLSSLSYFVCVILVRQLPITTGINTLLMIVIMIFVSIKIIGIKFKTSIISVLLTTIITTASELVNVIALMLIFGKNYENLINDPLSESIYTIPSTIVLFITIVVIHFFKIKSKTNKLKIN
jgi:hypothetical protein